MTSIKQFLGNIINSRILCKLFLICKIFLQDKWNKKYGEIIINKYKGMTDVLMQDENLFRIQERGDRQIAKAYRKAIILVGLTKQGKSTTFNWILHKLMIGAGTKTKLFYKNVIAHDDTTASVNESIISNTTAPNIAQYSKQEKITLMDMAGFLDKRNYAKVYCVSYFLKTVFEKVNQAKFIIVIDEENLKLGNGEGIMKTFGGFLDMFKLKQMDQKAKKQFYQSISLVVTKSEKPDLHKDYLEDICAQMKSQGLVADKKEEIVELIEYLIDSNRIDEFKKATFSEYAGKCTVIERFDKLKWDYFNIEQKYILLPFQKDFDNLPGKQQKLFEEVINNRITSFVKFSNILKVLISSINSRWESITYEWKENKMLDLKFSYSQLFQEIKSFLKLNDYYSSQEIVKQEFRIEYNEMNLIKIIKTVLELYKISEKVTLVEDEFQINMLRYQQLHAEICQQLRNFCSNKEEEHLIERLKFVLARGFKEFSKLHQIREEMVSAVNQKMKDNCNEVFQDKKNVFIERFVKEIDYSILSKMFDKIDGLFQYEEFFNNFQTQYKDSPDCHFKNFKEHRRFIEIARARLYEKNEDKKSALKCYLKVLKYLGEIGYNVSKSEDKSHDEIDSELNDLFMEKLTVLGFITNILKNLQNVPQAKNYALLLCKYVNNIEETCEIYELLVNQTGTVESKIECYSEYAEFCIKWGRLQQANALLQKKLSLERQSFNGYRQTIEKIVEVAKSMKNHTAYIDKYIEEIQQLGRIKEKDSQLQGYLEEIDLIVE